ncbi:MAG: hypothetical protein JWN98_136 [Abditibacteriota bacterium]|nr:hypothetical protein [Abditibacteriota bacterium]
MNSSPHPILSAPAEPESFLQAAFIGEASRIERVYAQKRFEHVAARVRLHPAILAASDFESPQTDAQDLLQNIDVLFSTWGMPALTDAHIAMMPRLRAVFYAAGSVQSFARPFLERGITVVSAWAANAVPVAEFALGQILLANKGYFRNTTQCATPTGRALTPFSGPGNFGETVAILGAGQIGRKLIELLRPFQLHIIVFDPFLPDELAREMDVEKVSLAEAFARSNVVSNHIANVPATRGLLNKPLFASMRPSATFINTGRGATVREEELIEVFQARPDLTALLDVTHPEPPRADSPFYRLPNVHLTSHIAGSVGDEVVRMADYVIEEFDRFARHEPLRYAVTEAMLETMA